MCHRKKGFCTRVDVLVAQAISIGKRPCQESYCSHLASLSWASLGFKNTDDSCVILYGTNKNRSQLTINFCYKLQHQSDIGWNGIMKGCISQEWGKLQQQYLTLNGRKKTGRGLVICISILIIIVFSDFASPIIQHFGIESLERGVKTARCRLTGAQLSAMDK